MSPSAEELRKTLEENRAERERRQREGQEREQNMLRVLAQAEAEEKHWALIKAREVRLEAEQRRKAEEIAANITRREAEEAKMVLKRREEQERQKLVDASSGVKRRRVKDDQPAEGAEDLETVESINVTGGRSGARGKEKQREIMGTIRREGSEMAEVLVRVEEMMDKMDKMAEEIKWLKRLVKVGFKHNRAEIRQVLDVLDTALEKPELEDVGTHSDSTDTDPRDVEAEMNALLLMDDDE